MDNPRSITRAQMMAVSPRGAILHSSALALGRKAILFLAASGGGKTTIARSLVARGWRLIGDDSVIVSEGTDGVLRTLPCGTHRMKTGEYLIEPAELRGIAFLEKGSHLILPVGPAYGLYRAQRIETLMAMEEVPPDVGRAAIEFMSSLFRSVPAVILRRRPDGWDEEIDTWIRSI